MKMSSENAENLKYSILHSNKILYCMRNRSCTETCVCWGLEVNNGWLNAIEDASQCLEALNYLMYPKFRVRVQADQVKEKYGTLHFYYSIVADPPKWMCAWNRLFRSIFDKISKLDFKRVEVLDKDAYDEVVEKELASREEFEKEKEANKNCCNVEVFEKDGKFIRRATYHHYKRTHFEATKHKLMDWLLNRRYFIENWPSRLFDFEPSHAQNCISKILEDKARDIVEKAEKDCYNVCEHCGRYISSKSTYSPRCTTRGWIAYLCQDCADKTGQQYVMNGSVWQAGKEVMTKKQYAEERAKADAAYRAAQEDSEEEMDDED